MSTNDKKSATIEIYDRYMCYKITNYSFSIYILYFENVNKNTCT